MFYGQECDLCEEAHCPLLSWLCSRVLPRVLGPAPKKDLTNQLKKLTASAMCMRSSVDTESYFAAEWDDVGCISFHSDTGQALPRLQLGECSTSCRRRMGAAAGGRPVQAACRSCRIISGGCGCREQESRRRMRSRGRSVVRPGGQPTWTNLPNRPPSPWVS